MDKLVKNSNEVFYETLSNSIIRVSYKLFGGDRMTLRYGTDVQIHGSEIHMICHIKNNPDSHLAKIAREMDVTRGAVSQIVNKLERKGLVEKKDDLNDAKRKKLVLTNKGERAYLGHQELHLDFVSSLEEAMKDYSDKERETIESFYSSLEMKINSMLKKL